MSIRIPYINYLANVTGLAVRLDLPSTAAQKPANKAFVLGMWIKCPSSVMDQTRVHTFMGRQGTNTGGNDAWFRFTDQGLSAIEGFVKSGSTQRFNALCTLSGSAYDKTLLVMLVCNSTHSHLVVVEPDGTQIVTTDASTQLYSVAMTSTPFLHRIGSGLTHGWHGCIDNYFFIHGAFPEVGGVPDPTLVAAIADGSQDIATLDAQLTGGVKQCWYKMADEFDLADAFGLNAALTPQLIDAPKGRKLYGGGPLRPRSLRPSLTHHAISNAIFATPGLAASGVATVRTEGGTYSGITPTAIQARLIKEDGSTHLDWTTVDAAPSAGTWAAGNLSAVPATASFLRLEFRAVDGVGAQIGEIVSSHGLRGVGFSLVSEHQSQGIHFYEAGSLALPDDIRLIVTRQTGAVSAFGQTLECELSSGCANNIRAGWGVRQAAIEFNTLYPGLPIQFSTVGESGEPLASWKATGTYVNRWGYLRDHFGVVPPYLMLFYGHSAQSGSTETVLGAVVTEVEATLGAPLKYVICPTARYAGLGNGGGYPAVQDNRDGARAWYEANKSIAYWGGSWSILKCDSGDTGPHPEVSADGHGRGGAQWAWACMMVSRAVEDNVIGLLSSQAVGTTNVLTFGELNT